jgi:hypothetical protein
VVGTISILKRVKKTQLSAGKVIVSAFWDSAGVSQIDFLPHGITNNAQYYSNLLVLRNDVHQAIRKKRLQTDDELKHGVLNWLGSQDKNLLCC